MQLLKVILSFFLMLLTVVSFAQKTIDLSNQHLQKLMSVTELVSHSETSPVKAKALANSACVEQQYKLGKYVVNE